MLRGELVLLRARTEDDARVLHAELYEDTETFVRADNRPWVPVPFGPGSPHWPKDVRSSSDAAIFAVTELATGDLAGEALLWGIDLHNRSAHVGLSLRPACRGRGLGADVVRVLCRYGFAIRGLHRLQLETLSDNHAMITVADRLGFTREGTARASSWVAGQWADDAVFGLLDTEFTGLVFALGCESFTGTHPYTQLLAQVSRFPCSTMHRLSTVIPSSGHSPYRRCAQPCPQCLWKTVALNLIQAKTLRASGLRRCGAQGVRRSRRRSGAAPGFPRHAGCSAP